MKKQKILELETISPALAEIYLARNMDKNRRKKKQKINLYAQDMKTGHWETDTPDNIISFNVNGELVNGQHRLEAIIASGKSVDMWVWRDVPETVHMFDRGISRSTADTLQIRGLNKDIASSATVAVVRKLSDFVYAGPVRWTDDIIGDYLEEYGAELWLCCNISMARCGKNRLMQNASCQCAIYIAYRYGVHEDELRDFAKVCASGIQDYPWQTGAILLRNFILDHTVDREEGNRKYLETLFMVANKAIWDFHSKIKRKTRYKVEALEDTPPVKWIRQHDQSFIYGITGKTV